MGAALLGSVSTAGSASAHSVLLDARPVDGAVLDEPPKRITLTFSENVSVVTSATRLYDRAGAEVAVSATSADDVVTVTPDSPLAPGTFQLVYRVISADSHPIGGSLAFRVKDPTATAEENADPVEPVAPVAVPSAPTSSRTVGVLQGVTYVGILLMAGLALFSTTMLPHGRHVEGSRRRMTIVTRCAAVVASTGALLLVPASAAYRNGTDLFDALASLGLGDATSSQGWTAILVVAASTVLARLAGREVVDARVRGVMLGAALIATASLAIVGHTRTYGPPGLVVTADVLHVVAAAVWLGGLVGLVIAVPALAGRERVAAETVSRFSTVAAASLATVTVAGVLLAWRILGSWSALLDTTYGTALIVKVGIAVLVAATAAWNRFRLVPGLQDASGHDSRQAAAGRVRRAVGVEAAGLLVVLCVTGILVQQSPRPMTHGDHGGHPASAMSTEVGGIAVDATLDPGMVGTNTLLLTLTDTDDPVRTYQDPTVRARSGETALSRTPAVSQGGGRYAAALQLPFAGTWEITVALRIDRFTERSATFEIEVA